MRQMNSNSAGAGERGGSKQPSHMVDPRYIQQQQHRGGGAQPQQHHPGTVNR